MVVSLKQQVDEAKTELLQFLYKHVFMDLTPLRLRESVGIGESVESIALRELMREGWVWVDNEGFCRVKEQRKDSHEKLDIPDSVCENVHALSIEVKTNRTLSVLDFLRKIKEEGYYSIDNMLYYTKQSNFPEAYEDWLNRTGNKR